MWDLGDCIAFGCVIPDSGPVSWYGVNSGGNPVSCTFSRKSTKKPASKIKIEAKLVNFLRNKSSPAQLRGTPKLYFCGSFLRLSGLYFYSLQINARISNLFNRNFRMLGENAREFYRSSDPYFYMLADARMYNFCHPEFISGSYCLYTRSRNKFRMTSFCCVFC